MTRTVIYHAHPLSGEYLGSGNADPDPLEPENWLIPASAYLEPPPEVDKGYVACRLLSSPAWEKVEDNRGTVYATGDGQAQMYNLLGPLPATLTRTPPPDRFHRWTEGSWVLDGLLQRAGVTDEVRFIRDEKLIAAGLRISPLQDAVDLLTATDKEATELTAWKTYRVALSRIEEQPGFPFDFEWPLSPEEH